MRIEKAKRIVELPPYLFAAIDKKKVELRKKGMDLIDLGIGDPDLPTPEPIIERLKNAAGNPAHHRYPSYEGMIDFRKAVSRWYQRRFGVSFTPETEVLSLIGSKEGIGHIHLAFVNPGDEVLIPDPGYPTYQGGTILAGGIPRYYPLRGENGFLPDLSALGHPACQGPCQKSGFIDEREIGRDVRSQLSHSGQHGKWGLRIGGSGPRHAVPKGKRVS